MGKAILTPREQQITTLVGVGLSNAGIARELAMSAETVKRHMSNIFDKVGCSSRAELAYMTRDESAEVRELRSEVIRAQALATHYRKLYDDLMRLIRNPQQIPRQIARNPQIAA